MKTTSHPTLTAQSISVEIDFFRTSRTKKRPRNHAAGKAWTTLGDIGHVDDDDYLYLTDRKAFMIISGGVNVYPQEVENRLITHAKVLDVAVFGVPYEDLG
jgi:long-chain acyl-CoA synthetase